VARGLEEGVVADLDPTSLELACGVLPEAGRDLGQDPGRRVDEDPTLAYGAQAR
jgi:hypothetical protein